MTTRMSYDTDLRDDPAREHAEPATVHHYHPDDRPDYVVGRRWPMACDLEHRILIVSSLTLRVRRVAGGRIDVSGLGPPFSMAGVVAVAVAIGVADWLDQQEQLPSADTFAQLREELMAHA